MKAVFTAVTGDVVVRTGRSSRPAKSGLLVRPGDTVELSGKDAFASLRMDDGSRVRLSGTTRLRFEEMARGEGKAVVTRLRLLTGRVWAKVAKLRAKTSAFEIKAGGVVCGVRGTTLAGQRSSDGNRGAFYNFSGKVFVSDGKRERMIDKGKGCSFAGGLLGDFVEIPEDLKSLNDAADDGRPGKGRGGAFDDAGNGADGPVPDLGSELGALVGGSRDADSNMTAVQSDQVHAIDILFDSPENSRPIWGGGGEVIEP